MSTSLQGGTDQIFLDAHTTFSEQASIAWEAFRQIVPNPLNSEFGGDIVQEDKDWDAQHDKAELIQKEYQELVKPTTAKFSQRRSDIPDPDVSFDDYYEKQTVERTDLPLRQYDLHNPEEIPEIHPYTVSIGDTAVFMDGVKAAVDTAIGTLEGLNVSINLNYQGGIDRFYQKIWASGFIDLLQAYNSTNLQFVRDAVHGRADAGFNTVAQALGRALNKRGFSLPNDLVDAANDGVAFAYEHSALDIDRELDFALDEFLQRVYSLGLTAEELSEGFTKAINNKEIEFDKIRFAAVAAEAKGRLDLFTGQVEGMVTALRLIMESSDIAMQYLELEREKIQATLKMSESWSVWADAIQAVNRLVNSINKAHFTEQDGLLKVAEKRHEFSKALADGAVMSAEAQIEKDIAEKTVELTQNSAEHMKAAAQLAITALVMKRFDVELKAYTKAYTTEIDKLKLKAEGILPKAEQAGYAGRLLSSLINKTYLTIEK